MLTREKKYIPILKCTVTTITYMHNKLTQFILLRYCNECLYMYLCIIFFIGFINLRAFQNGDHNDMQISLIFSKEMNTK